MLVSQALSVNGSSFLIDAIALTLLFPPSLPSLGLVIGLEKLENISEEAMDTMIDTNVKGLVHVTQSVLPGMRARNKGHIINIGSVAGQQAYANGAVYCASKAAVASISKALLYETVDTAIRISEINPGKWENGRDLAGSFFAQKNTSFQRVTDPVSQAWSKLSSQ